MRTMYWQPRRSLLYLLKGINATWRRQPGVVVAMVKPTR